MTLSFFDYNGMSTHDFGLLVSGVNIFGAPNRKVEKASVPGRNGDIIIELGGFDNYQVAYQVSIIDNTLANVSNIKNWLLPSEGYQMLCDSYDTTHFRLAACYQSIEYIMTQFYRYGQATIVFDCKPQRFLNSGLINKTKTGTSGTLQIENPTRCTSRPMISVTKAGTLTIQFEDGTTETVKVTSMNGASTVYIDSENMQCYDNNGNNMGAYVQMDHFPEFPSGVIDISMSFGSSCTLTVVPRWWEL